MKAQRAVIIALYVVAMFMVSIDGTIVNVLLPTIAVEFGVPPGATNGINIGYLVSIAVALPAAGYLSNRFGVKRMYVLSVSLFTLASLLCGLAGSLQALILARVLQGLAGGIITPVSMTLLFRTFPPPERQNLSRSLVLPIAFAPAIGPLVGGLFSEYLSWNWAFFINIPFGIVIVLIGLFALTEFEIFEAPFDTLGYMLIALGLPLLMLTLSLIASDGVSITVVFCAIVGIFLLSSFYVYERKIKEPLLDVRLYEQPLFLSSSLVAMCSMGALMGMLYLFPLMYQYAYSASALESSLITFTEALGLMVASKLLPRTSKRFGMLLTVRLGLIGTVMIFCCIAILGPSANPWLLRALMFAVGICLGHSVIGSQLSAFHHVAKSQMSKATTLYNMLNRVGAAVGIALVATTLTVSGRYFSEILSYQYALVATVVLLLAGLGCSLIAKEQATILKGEKA
ncbi:DHA2 family efflux MFS transporter permease subunit [Solibacillus sp. FSL R5-0449]|uniref:DHA2 family efflux MFS transporter permease subunit n=1 Tax=Solibacillus sp. FSL R5-0449 TaxID=2921639 RepID=UPI0030CEAE0A